MTEDAADPIDQGLNEGRMLVPFCEELAANERYHRSQNIAVDVVEEPDYEKQNKRAARAG
jgi:hypothetical protein